MQISFVTELFEAAKTRSIHTCLDTSGITFHPEKPGILKQFDRLMEVTDLVLLDIKNIDPDAHVKLTGQKLDPVLAFAQYLDEKSVPVWLRHVIVPGITYKEDLLYQLGQFIATLHNIRSIDVLPYHDMGKTKYKNLGISYPLEKVAPLGQEEALAAQKVILRGIRDKQVVLQGLSRQ